MLDNSSAPGGAVITITPLDPRTPLLGNNALVSYDAAAGALVLSVPVAPVHSVDAIDAYLVELFSSAGGRASLRFPASGASPWSQAFTPALFPELWSGSAATFSLGYRVRAHSKHGYGLPSARGEVEVRRPAARPSLSSPPVVTGNGKIGSQHSVAGQAFTGADAVSIQWFRGSEPIAGAIADSYTPAAADDLAELSVVATATNSAGSVTAKSNLVQISYPAPGTSGAIGAQSFAQKAGARFDVATAAAFTGPGLSFALDGTPPAGVGVDAATGVVSGPLGALIAGATVTVRARNSGGSATQSFTLTVSAGVTPSTMSLAGAKETESFAGGHVIETFAVKGSAVGRNVGVKVLLPPNYATKAATTKYHLVLALPGQSAPLKTIVNMPNLRTAQTTRPMIWVTFDASKDAGGGMDSWYQDSPLSSLPLCRMTSFVDELLPWLLARYSTTGKIGCCGFSMGAFGAMHYMCVKPARFGAVAGMSGAYLGYTRTADFLNPILGTRAKYPARWDALDLEKRINALSAAKVALPPIRLSVAVGGGDVINATRDFRDYLQGKKLLTAYDESVKGGHDYAAWHAMIGGVSSFLWTHLQAG